MLTIRLQRVGKTKKPTYRLVISEKARDPQDRHLELLGTYNPHDKEKGVAFNVERIQYWIGKGAQTSNTVHNLLLKSGAIKGKVARSVYLSTDRKKKMDDKKKAAAPKAEAAPAPVAETPAV